MFERFQLVFFHCVSPVHVGAGQAIGAIDNPIQRERHTGYPCFAASGLKGALRDYVLDVRRGRRVNRELLPEEEAPMEAEALTDRLFGPLPKSGEEVGHAGCVAFADAQLLLFPVRSPRHAFAWITCPTAWERFRRSVLIANSGLEPPALDADVVGMHCLPALPSQWDAGAIVLDSLRLEPADAPDVAADIAAWLQAHAFPSVASFRPFADKLSRHLVVVSNLVFSHFVTHATLVEPHVKIDDVTGTVEEKLFFYTENLPPESVLFSLLMLGRERTKDGRGAEEVLADLKVLDGQLVQIGGDATTGRGLVVLHFATNRQPAEGR